MMAHVVVVDDEEIMRSLVEHVVSMLGWTCESATSGILGLRIIERVVPDLVITDVGMPGLNGIELLRRIKEDPRLAHIPVIIISSVNRETEAREAGCAAYLTKPFALESLLQILPQAAPPPEDLE